MTSNDRSGGFRFGLLSKYRSVLMGAAIIMIMFCHLDVAQSHNAVAVTKLASLLQTFTVGVDIFLFLSGIGLYYSYTKRPVKYLAFEKKRILRVLPMYLVIAGVTYIIFDLFIKQLGMIRFIQDLLFVSWPKLGSTKYWYILAILAFYLIFPPAYKLLGSRRSFVPLLVFCVIWWTIFETLSLKYDVFFKFRIALSRLPIFLLGIYCGKLSYRDAPIKTRLLIPLTIAGYAALIVLKRAVPQPYYHYLYYPVRGLLSLSVISTAILLMELIEHNLPKLHKGLTAALSWFGGLTLELYLLHQSSLILFEYPCRFVHYVIAAFLIPTAAAAALFLLRKLFRKAD